MSNTKDTPLGLLKQESKELDVKINSLESFIDKGKPDHISIDSWDLLLSQLNIMHSYNEVLIKRIAIF